MKKIKWQIKDIENIAKSTIPSKLLDDLIGWGIEEHKTHKEHIVCLFIMAKQYRNLNMEFL